MNKYKRAGEFTDFLLDDLYSKGNLDVILRDLIRRAWLDGYEAGTMTSVNNTIEIKNE